MSRANAASDRPCERVVPVNDGDLPTLDEFDEEGKYIRTIILWRGFSIREQFPWTRLVGE